MTVPRIETVSLTFQNEARWQGDNLLVAANLPLRGGRAPLDLRDEARHEVRRAHLESVRVFWFAETVLSLRLLGRSRLLDDPERPCLPDEVDAVTPMYAVQRFEPRRRLDLADLLVAVPGKLWGVSDMQVYAHVTVTYKLAIMAKSKPTAAERREEVVREVCAHAEVLVESVKYDYETRELRVYTRSVADPAELARSIRDGLVRAGLLQRLDDSVCVIPLIPREAP